MTARPWSGKTDGTPWMLRSLVVLLRRLDVRVLYGVMAVVVVFYIIFRPRGTRAQYLLLRHRMGWSRWRSCIGVYRNHYMFGQVILDRFACYAGKRYKILSDGMELMEQWMGGKDSFIVLSSHIGNHEMAGYSIEPHDKKMFTLFFAGEKQTVTEYRKQMLRRANIEMIMLTDDLSHVFLIHEALSSGAVVTFPSDRIYGASKTLAADVLGAPANLPQGPFSTAVMHDTKVMALFVMKDAWDTYHMYFKPLPQPSADLPKRERMQVLADAYAALLSDMVRRYPTQWFHYYDFWNEEYN